MSKPKGPKENEQGNTPLIRGEKILVTGAAGNLGLPICRELARGNQVYGLARFTDARRRDELEAVGVKLIKKDLDDPDLSDVPDDFSYVIHTGAVTLKHESVINDQPYVFEVNAQAPGRLMYRCRRAKCFVHCSTGSVYAYPGHDKPLKETTPFGIHIPAISLSKIAAEAVVTFASRQWNIPTVMIRIMGLYGPLGGRLASSLDSVIQGKEIRLHPDKPNHYNPVYESDQVGLTLKALTVGRVPPLAVNFAGPALTNIEECLAYMGELVGKKPKMVYTPEMYTPLWPDITFMEQVLGKPKVGWREGILLTAQARYPQLKLRLPAG